MCHIQQQQRRVLVCYTVSGDPTHISSADTSFSAVCPTLLTHIVPWSHKLTPYKQVKDEDEESMKKQ